MNDDARVQALLDELFDSDSTPEQVCAGCPELLPEVRRRWQQMRRLECELDVLFPTPGRTHTPEPQQPREEPLPRVPGYEIQGVLGRGGMGVVYRAWHLRLNRCVALKMLLAGPCARPDEQERFQREAEAVAALHSPNVVQVYDVGDVDGRPYFTMELIEGGNLADRIQGLPRPARQAAALVATLADAIHQAHQSGIVHRDLKPSNILLQFSILELGFSIEGSQTASIQNPKSKIENLIPKITDFGLARRLEDDGGLTLSGVPIGTPSYMAPEQARGTKKAIGPATDVYALGAILYEMLTGRPPFRAETTTATLHQVVTEEPIPPMRLNPQVPRDLQTICLKCLAKEPQRRYPSAAALAEDLRRFLRSETIAARPAGRMERLARWSRRRPAAAVLLVGALLFAITMLGGAGWLIGRQILTARAVEADLREADRLQRQSDFPEALAALNRARSRLGAAGPFWLYPVVDAAQGDHEFLSRLEAIRVSRCTLAEGGQTHAAQMRFNKARADRDYAEAFRDRGLGEPPDDPAGAAARVQASKWTAHLVTALNDWAVCAADPARQDWLLTLARRADPDPWRDRVRDPAVWRDGKQLSELARAVPADQPVSLLLALGERLTACGEDGVGLLRRVQEQHPEDFWANFTLALALHGPQRYPGGKSGPALVYYEKAHQIRPQAVAVLNDLGMVLLDIGWMMDDMRDGGGPGAYTVFYRAVKSDARFAPSFNNLGVALKGYKGDWGLSVLLFRDAVQIDPQLAPAHFNLAEIRAGSGHLDEAIDHFRQALAIDPDFGLAHCSLGLALVAKGRRDEVDECYPERVEALEHLRGQALRDASNYYWQAFLGDPEWVPARNQLRIPPQDEARLNEALDHYRQAVRLAPEFAHTHAVLGLALFARREFNDAETETRRGLHLLAEWEKDRRPVLERLLQWCQRLRALEARLPAVVQGKDRPAADDCLDLAVLCFVKNHHATAARLYAEALAAKPGLTDDLRAGHRFNAARAAALAGRGQGDDIAGLTEFERARLRKQARHWLRLDLNAWAQKIDTGAAADRIQALKTLAPWGDEPDLAGLRDAAPLERLPEAERQECQTLWQAVAALLRRAQTIR
jgi:serine/threonine-protein kinase